MRLWGRKFGTPLVGETKPAPVTPEMVLIEFVCMAEGCEFQTLSLTEASQHIADTKAETLYGHQVEPRGYYYKKEPL